MNDIQSISDFLTTNANELDLVVTLFNFTVCALMSFVVRAFYIHRSFSLTGKMHIGSIIPVLSAVTFTVIIVVKSSLALSLGLVGALSIVRFRTPIKEPEELVYLFMAISLGLGYGAGYVAITTLLTTGTLMIIYFWLSNLKVQKKTEYNLVVNWNEKSLTLDKLISEIDGFAESLSLVRLENSQSASTAVLLISPVENTSLDGLIEKISNLDPNMNLTFFEAKTNW